MVSSVMSRDKVVDNAEENVVKCKISKQETATSRWANGPSTSRNRL